MKDIAPMSASVPNPALYFVRYAPHSNVLMSSLIPTFARSPWIAVAMLFGDCMPEPDSGIQKTALKPLGYPASASSCLALFWSYGYFVTSSVYAHLIEGGIGPFAVVPVPFKMSLEIASRFVAYMTACRTFRSLKGFLSRLNVAHQMCGPGCSTYWYLLSDLTCATLSGGTSTMASAFPDLSSVKRVCSSGMGRNTILSRSGAPSQ